MSTTTTPFRLKTWSRDALRGHLNGVHKDSIVAMIQDDLTLAEAHFALHPEFDRTARHNRWSRQHDEHEERLLIEVHEDIEKWKEQQAEVKRVERVKKVLKTVTNDDVYAVLDSADYAQTSSQMSGMVADYLKGKGHSDVTGNDISSTWIRKFLDALADADRVTRVRAGEGKRFLKSSYSVSDKSWAYITPRAAKARTGVLDNKADLIASFKERFAAAKDKATGFWGRTTDDGKSITLSISERGDDASASVSMSLADFEKIAGV